MSIMRQNYNYILQKKFIIKIQKDDNNHKSKAQIIKQTSIIFKNWSAQKFDINLLKIEDA